MAPELAEVVPVSSAAGQVAPEVDEDWQVIYPRWQPEHWEIIRLLYQEQSAHLAPVDRKVHSPLSLLIDEINDPVAELLDDSLVDPETLTLFPHLHEVAEELIRWYFSSHR